MTIEIQTGQGGAPSPSDPSPEQPPQAAKQEVAVPDWAAGLRDAAGLIHAALVTEPKHESLRILHDELKAALDAWDKAIAAGA